jgi:4-amino-4-deoxy-L-arabinose transferase-like glycosyltransferase
MKNKKYLKILIIIEILALIFRLAYIIKTPYTSKQHDLDLSYILTIYETGHLPETNEGQYYHPPLHQIIGAIFLRIENLFVNNITTNIAGESLQFLTVIYSMILLYIIYNIVKEIKLKEKYILFVMFIAAFHPTLIILSGSLNNDELCLVLIMWTMLRLIKWYKKPNIKNIIFLAIITGLAVMTKTNGGIVAIPIIYVFLLRLYREIKKSKNKLNIVAKYIKLFIVFGIIALPIGLWYNIRNYILFNQPILYVLDPKVSSLYVGNYSMSQRLIPFSKEIFDMYCHVYEDYNIPIYVLKCSLFGEFIWSINSITNLYYIFAIICNLIFYIFSLYCIIKNIIKKNKRRKIYQNIFFLLFITNIISFILMNIKLPYGCSMDFRYIVPTIFVQSFFICFELENLMRKNAKKEKMISIFIFEIIFILMFTSNVIILG